MEKITNIEELIADAKAEEEVRREQVQDDLTNALMRSFTANLNKDAESKGAESKGARVTVSLAEYVQLKQMELDYARLFSAIIESFGLSYHNDHLIISKDDIILQTFKVLHAEEFKELEQDMVDEWNKEHPDGEVEEDD
jgi:Fe-S cluster assembly iron-binding protein IscA